MEAIAQDLVTVIKYEVHSRSYGAEILLPFLILNELRLASQSVQIRRDHARCVMRQQKLSVEKKRIFSLNGILCKKEH